MFAQVNGASLFLDVVGSGLIPEPDATALHFSGSDGEMNRFDFRDSLQTVTRPVLLMHGDGDPITPAAGCDVPAHALLNAQLQVYRYDNSGHAVVPDKPEALVDICQFIEGLGE